MKFKADFVTNSSTTSFIAYGASFHISDLNENSIVLQAMYQEYLKTKEDSNTHRTMVVKSGEESQDTPDASFARYTKYKMHKIHNIFTFHGGLGD